MVGKWFPRFGFQKIVSGTSLVGQWLRLHAPNAGDLGYIPGQGTRSHTLQLKILHAKTETQHSQTNKHKQAFPGGTADKNLSANAEDTGSIPGLGISHVLWSS